jgi:uncharacterized protein (DUF362 family)
MKHKEPVDLFTNLPINRRNFLKFSAGTASAAAILMLSNSTFASLNTSKQKYAGQGGSVWVSNEGANSWEVYYQKFVRLMTNKNNGLDLGWMQSSQRYLLKVTLNADRPYPYSTDPKLVYSTIRYLIEKKSIAIENIILTDQFLSTMQGDLTNKIKAVKTSGIYSGLRRAMPLKQHQKIASLQELPLNWLTENSDFDRIIELSNISTSSNQERLANIAKSIIETSDLKTNNSLDPSLVISSATRVGIEIGNESHIVTHQPGMILASNNLLSHELLADAYLRFSANEKTAINHINNRIVADKKQVFLNQPLAVKPLNTFENDNGLRTLSHVTKQAGHPEQLNWYFDTQGAPLIASQKIRGYLDLLGHDHSFS